MQRRFVKRPTRLASALAVVMGIGMLVFFLSFIGFGNLNNGFFVFWFVGLLLILGYHLFNALSGNAPAMEVIVESDGDSTRSVADRLQDLEVLEARGLITQEEHRTKRAEILTEV